MASPAENEFDIYSCHYNDFFLLRTPITINEKTSKISMVEGKPYVHMDDPKLKIGIFLADIVPSMMSILQEHGLCHVHPLHEKQALLFSVMFPSRECLREFLEKIQFLQAELQHIFFNGINRTTKPHCALVQQSNTEVIVKCELFLVSPAHFSNQAKPNVNRVTKENFSLRIDQWQQSKIFTFNSDLFHKKASTSIKDDEADLRDLQRELRRIVRQWFALGLELKIPTEELEAIELDNHYKVEPCRLHMLIKWSELEKPTWSKLVRGLVNIGQHDVARDIAKKYGVKMTSRVCSTNSSKSERELSLKLERAEQSKTTMNKEVEEKATKIASLQERVVTLELENHELKLQVQTRNAELEKLNEMKIPPNVVRHHIKVREKEQQIRDLQEKLNKNEAELNLTKRQLNKSEKELEEKTKELQVKSDEVRRLHLEMESLQESFSKQNEEMTQRLLEADVRYGEQEEILDETKASLYEAIEEASQMKADIFGYEHVLSNKEKVITELNEKCSISNREIHELKATVQSQEISERVKIQQLEKVLAQMQSEIIKLKLEKKEIEEQVQQKQVALQQQEKIIFNLVTEEVSTEEPKSEEVMLTVTEEFSSSEEPRTEVVFSFSKVPRSEEEFSSSEEPRSEEVILKKPTNEKINKLFSLLDLHKFYPQKLTLTHAFTVHKVMENCTDPKQLYLFILQKIKAYDYRCRGKLLHNSSHSKALFFSDSDDDLFGANFENSFDNVQIHPMDSLLALIHCADDFLRQDLMTRLVDCKISIPLILPDPFTRDLTFPLWAMRAIVKEWRSKLKGNKKFHECPLVSYPNPIISFVRFGKNPGKSKSKMLNDVINDSCPDIFFHRDCEGGSFNRLLGEGVVEVSWYLPAGKPRDIFPDLLTFLNLHGNALEHPQQIAFLSEVSFMIFALFTEEDLNEESTKVVRQLSAVPGGVVLCTTSKPSKLKQLNEDIPNKLGCLKLATKTADEIKKDIRDRINQKLKNIWASDSKAKVPSLEACSETANKHSIYVDENKQEILQGQKMVQALQEMLTQHPDKDCSAKERMLPLQGKDLWQKWATQDKEEHRQFLRGGMRIEEYSSQKQKEKKQIRKLQLQHVQKLSPLMESFIKYIFLNSGIVRNYFLQCLKLYLNNLSRSTIALWQHEYKKKRSELLALQREKKANKDTVQEIEALHRKIINASLGLEHLLRELAQVYEAVQETPTYDKERAKYSRLPQLAAQLLTEGYPLELMDGDAAHVPKTWVTAVMKEATKLLNNPRVFVLSVLGLQSTGKSTLINTTFGLQFNVGAGRCTRGAFMQLLPISDQLKHEANCDYILVVDTEGLRAPELDSQKMQQHDNELATFVIGLANSTLINIYGETPGDMDDILQTAVHAFIRMKSAKALFNPSCQFVHQNVASVGASDKGGMGRSKFKDKLDRMTSEAAKEEKCGAEIEYFSDVIHFDEEKDVHHFQSLWKGDPPMAPINPGYSEKALSLRTHIVQQVKQTSGLNKFSEIQIQIEDLWKALLHEKFVFSFKNTLELSVYNSLEAKYVQWSWNFRSKMLEWERNAGHEIKNSTPDQIKALERKLLQEKLPSTVSTLHEEIKSELLRYFEESEQRDMLAQWQTETINRLKRLVTELKDHAYDHCRELIKSQKAREDIKKKNAHYQEQLMKRVKVLVSQLSKENLPKSEKEVENQLRSIFDEQWSGWIKELQKDAPAQTEDIHEAVELEVQKSLVEVFPSEEMNLVKKISAHNSERSKKMHQPLKLTLSEKHVNMKTKPRGLLSTVTNFVYGRKTEPTLPVLTNPKYLRHVQNNVKDAFESTEEYLASKQNDDFNPTLTYELLGIIKKVIGQDDHPDFVYTKEYELDVSITACRYAIEFFTGMRQRFLKDNDPIEFLEREMKDPLFTVFKNQFHRIAGEKIAACTFCDLIAGSIRREVEDSLGSIIFEDMKHLPHLANKSALQARILLDLGDNLTQQCTSHDLSDYFLHLRNVAASCKKWLIFYTKEHCTQHESDNEDSRLAVLAKRTLNKLMHTISEEVKEVTEENECNNEIDTNEWLSSICTKLASVLDMSVFDGFQDLGGVKLLKDVQNFTEEVQKGLGEIQDNLVLRLASLRIDDLKEKPYDLLFAQLCGCTEQCPFCGEQCDCTNDEHTVKHSVQQHRPTCLMGWHVESTNEMATDMCSTAVGSDKTVKNKDTNDEAFPYKRYQEKYPKWAIPIDMSAESSLYWKWFVGNYSKQIAERYGLKDNEIPSNWKKYTWEEAKKDVEDTY